MALSAVQKSKRQRRLRLTVQIGMIALVFGVTAGKYFAGKGLGLLLPGSISIHTICPFGGVVTLYQLFTTGDYLAKIHASAVFLLCSSAVAALLFGAVFCGYFCPFGSVQEFIGRLGKKICGKKHNHFVPRPLDAVLRYARYLAAALVIIKTALAARLIFADIDPYNALFNFFTGEVAPTAFAALGAVVLLSLFIERPWCKYLCPYGAVLGLSNAVSLFKIRRTVSVCTNCAACDNVCPMNIAVSRAKNIISHQCIRCYKCLSGEGCPQAAALVIAAAAVPPAENRPEGRA